MIRPSSLRPVRWGTIIALLLSGSIAAGADVVGGANGISLAGVSSKAHNIRITGPNGYLSVTDGAEARTQDAAPLADGVYRYEVTEMQCVTLSHEGIKAARRNNAANGRANDAQPSSCRQVVVDTGAFRIVNGAVPDSTLVEE